MGGYQMHFLGYPHAHNTWIDIADAAVTYLYSADLLTPTQNEIYAANGEIAEEIDASDYQNVVNMVLK
jgi:hypothetical protein